MQTNNRVFIAKTTLKKGQFVTELHVRKMTKFESLLMKLHLLNRWAAAKRLALRFLKRKRRT